VLEATLTKLERVYPKYGESIRKEMIFLLSHGPYQLKETALKARNAGLWELYILMSVMGYVKCYPTNH